MQIAAKRNRVLTTVSSLNRLGGISQAVEQEEFYQYITFALMSGAYRRQLTDVGNELIVMADHAINLRQSEVAERISGILINAPLPCKYQNIGQYYRALSVKQRLGLVATNAILEGVASSPMTPLRYRARALQAIGGNHLHNGKATEALRFFLEAGHIATSRLGRDLRTAMLSPWMIAVLQSIDGDHKRASEGLEKLSPLVRMIAPVYSHYYYFYANARDWTCH